MASSSSCVDHKIYKYDVFLSFSGEDTRKTFVDHLYEALVRLGICTFKDDEKLEKGSNISDDLLHSIELSRMYIIVFSKRYASSSWCLNELLKIMECYHKNNGHAAFPVFYDVDPSEVRKQNGLVGDALATLMDRSETEVAKWREALKEAADLSGWALKNTAVGHEKVIKFIVKKVSLMLPHISFVGIEQRMQDLSACLEIGLDDVLMIGIKGMGGAGKTTLAQAIFDKISFSFEGRSFVYNVRENAFQYGLHKLQELILRDVLKDNNITVSGVHEGKKLIKNKLHGKKVLVVLDDVDCEEQLEELAGDPNWFFPGSRIIITTRDEHVLNPYNVKRIIEVDLLSDEEAIRLFSMHAFGSTILTEDFEKQSHEVVRYAAGHPLTIKVLGSLLNGSTKPEWIDVLSRLKIIPLRVTLDKLRLSYECLEDDHKEIFLDVACFLRHWGKDDAVRLLESCGFFAEHGLSVLEAKSLIKIVGTNLGGSIQLHGHIVEMGENIVRRKHPYKPYKHTRLWVQNEIEHVLANCMGTEETQCIEFQITRSINLEAVGNMTKLRCLIINRRREDPYECIVIDETRQYFPNSLQYLYWGMYPHWCLPNAFEANNLVSLEMPHSNIEQLWKRGKVMMKLKFLGLTNNIKLKSLDLGMMPNLERLDLSCCFNLRVIPSNICMLKRLKELILKNCWRLKELPDGLGDLECLQLLNITGTSITLLPPSISLLKGLEIRRSELELPGGLRDLDSLQLLNHDGTGVTHLPPSVSLLKGLKIKKSELASSSSCVNNRIYKYDVFLSFICEDTRKTFVDHLNAALEQQGICTFKDDERLEKGRDISDDPLQTIEDSRFYIIIFSKRYVSSPLCLNELLKIMECCHITNDHTAFPVFYDVDPSEVQKQNGLVGKALATLTNKSETEVANWREALKESANLTGWDLKNTADGHEAEVIKLIVERVSLDLPTIDYVDDNLVGMEQRMRNLNACLGIDSNDVRMIGIKGMGGAGKTTLAWEIFDRISFSFEGRSFVENVSERASRFGLIKIQEQILRDVLNDNSITVSGVHEGKKFIKNKLHGRKVLVVLDDVDREEQLEELAGDPNWFFPGSRIIITTRDEQVLNTYNVKRIIEVDLLSDEEANCLFNRHAFRRTTPTQDFEKQSHEVVRYAAGLPFTIKVLGSFLRGKTKPVWIDTLSRLKTIPLKETLEKLRRSYESLEDDHKEIFLHVACFLRHWEKDDAVRLLESCGFFAEHGLSVLEAKSLIKIVGTNLGGSIQLHGHIVEMGENIVRREHPYKPYKHTRLWVQNEIEHVLANCMGTEETRCIEFQITRSINLEAVGNMTKLRCLIINRRRDDPSECIVIDEARQYFPNSLQYLYWGKYPHWCLPNAFEANNLVSLEMPHSNIEQLWKRGKVMKKLKFLDLTNNVMLKSLDLAMMPNLERLDVSCCFNLRDIPSNICMLKCLKELILKSCWRLMELPDGLADLECLQLLDITGTSITRLPPSICLLEGLEIRRSELELPDGVRDLDCLQLLNNESTDITIFPPSISLLKGLTFKRSELASSSSSVHDRIYKYDVFLSYSSEDTRKTFVEHLNAALSQQGICTFKDDESLEKKRDISDDPLQTIEDSRFYIIVFSKCYASSSRCLNELLKIMECCHNTNDHTAFPVFYDVNPSEVRKQIGLVGEALAKLKNKSETEITRWREALKELANISGWDLKNTVYGHEAAVIKLIVKQVAQDLPSIDIFDENLIGMEQRIQDFNACLDIGLNDVRMIGIKGMGGAGKTTLAHAIFDKISFSFEGRSFVENVRERASQFRLIKIQKQILRDLLNDNSIIVDSVLEGKNLIKQRLCRKKVLVVLDDVDDEIQLESLVGDPSWFKPGSRIIITTRDEHVLNAFNMKRIIEVKLLSDEEAILLFSRHAFGRTVPTQEFEKQLHEIVRYAAGLPLTIKVLASHLRGKNKYEWIDTLSRLKTIPLKETLNKLELSYESLENDHKDIFLDVACFLRDQRTNNAIRMLESCGFDANKALRVLQQKSIIKIEGTLLGGTIELHDNIIEMGTNIVRRMHPDEPGRHTRLWIQEEIEGVLADGLGAETRCIDLRITRGICLEGLENMKILKCLMINRRVNNSSHDLVKIDESRQYFPNSLQYLYWRNYSHWCLPKPFKANNLVSLEMPHSKIKQLWEEGKVMKKLRFLFLPYTKLESLDIRLTPNLERLQLDNCIDLVKLFGDGECLKNLFYLNLSGCKKLRSLDLGIMPNLKRLNLKDCLGLAEFVVHGGCLESLVYLNLSFCHSLTSFLFIEQFESLEVLHVEALNLMEFPEYITTSHSTNSLLELNLSFNYDIKEVPSSTGNLCNLVSLTLFECHSLKILPGSICSLQHLRTLNLRFTSIENLPDDLGQLECLENLNLGGIKVKHLPDSICMLKHLKTLDLRWCQVLEKLPDNVGMLESLERLDLVFCSNLREIPTNICKLTHLKELELQGCRRLETLPDDLGNLKCLLLLDIRDTCITHLPPDLSLLQDLKICRSELGDQIYNDEYWSDLL